MISEVYDIEVLCNLFTYTGYRRQDKTFHQFVIHESRNDLKELIQHLSEEGLVMVGFNNESYDYPIVHHLINHYNDYISLTGKEIAEKVYQKSQEIIAQEFSTISDKNKFIPQVDLYKIWHYDNPAKKTSLKNLEVAMNLEFVEDMPFSHDHLIKSTEIEKVLSYNKKDVVATSRFLDITQGNTDMPLYKDKNKLQLRYAIKRKFGLNCINHNDIKLGTELILKLYCEKFGKDIYKVRKLRTPRPEIHLKDCLPEWMDFKTPYFDSVIEKFKNLVIYNGETKNKFEMSAIYNGINIDYGAGGAHACIKPGVYTSDEEYGIYDVDIDLTQWVN